MSARTIRRTFASSVVVTLAAIPACVVQTAPPPRGGPPVAQPGPRGSDPGPQPTETTPTQSQPTVVANPPRPGMEPTTPPTTPPPAEPAKYERHWTVTRQGDKCMAYTDVSCPKNATCNPPPPTAYTCTAEITATKPMKIVQWANTVGCHVEAEAPPCPPKTMCEPPRPRAVTCPQ